MDTDCFSTLISPLFVFSSVRTGMLLEIRADRLPGMKFQFQFGTQQAPLPDVFYNVLTVIL